MSDVPSDIVPLIVTPLNHDVISYTVFTGVAEFFRLNGIRVRAAVAARALGVVASDLQDTHADEIAQGDSDLPPLNIGKLTWCPTCLQIRPPATQSAEYVTTPVATSESDFDTAPASDSGSDATTVAAAAVEDTLTVSVTAATAIGGAVPQDVAEVDLTLPSNAVVATVDALCCMSRTDKTLLKANLDVARRYRNALTLEQSCALNIGDIVIPAYDTGAGYQPPTYMQFMTRNGPVVQKKIAAADRWYVVQVGKGFTGVVRGYNNYKNHVPTGVANVLGQVCGSREEAEMTWLCYYHRNSVGTV